VADFTQFFALTFSALLPLVNPLGSALVFLGLVGIAPPEIYRHLAKRIAIATVIFLIIIEVAGALLLRFFGISLPIVQISGGLALAAMGWDLLNQGQGPNKTADATVDPGLEFKSLEQKVFYPFTFPGTAGPGCIVVIITLSAHASSQHGLQRTFTHVGIAAAIALLSLGVYFCYAHAPQITTRVSPQTVHGILRLIAFVLLCIGVQILTNGVQTIVKTTFSLPPTP